MREKTLMTLSADVLSDINPARRVQELTVRN